MSFREIIKKPSLILLAIFCRSLRCSSEIAFVARINNTNTTLDILKEGNCDVLTLVGETRISSFVFIYRRMFVHMQTRNIFRMARAGFGWIKNNTDMDLNVVDVSSLKRCLILRRAVSLKKSMGEWVYVHVPS